MTAWTAFALVTLLLLAVVVGLARATTRVVEPGSPAEEEPGAADTPPTNVDTPDHPDRTEPAVDHPIPEPDIEPSGRSDRRDRWNGDRPEHGDLDRSEHREADRPERPDRREDRFAERADPETGTIPDLEALGTALLFANVLATHGLFALVLLGAAWWFAIPAAALGVGAGTVAPSPAILLGVAFGAVLYLANALLAANLDLVDVEANEGLRRALAPETPGGWLVLVAVILPLIALSEELLFRAAAIGALAAGFPVSPWLLVVASSVAFGLGHDLQGRGGVLVTGLLGAVLGTAFVLTESLLLVVVAHYVVNVAEFVVHEGLGVDGRELFAVR